MTSRADILRWDTGEVIPGTEGITLEPGIVLNGWNSDSHNLRYGDFGGNLAGSELHFSSFDNARFQNANLTGVSFVASSLVNANLREANLTNASFRTTSLTNADFTGATVTGAFLAGATSDGFTASQLYSTQSYQAKNLSGIVLGRDLSGWDFREQNLSGAAFSGATLTNAILTGADLTNASMRNATLTGANLEGADTRGASDLYAKEAVSRNTILSNGQIMGLSLELGDRLEVRNYTGDPSRSRGPIPVSVQDHMTISPGGVLELRFEADPWDSLISFESGIPVELGGTLELVFTPEVNLAAQVGRTLRVFDWQGVDPSGRFQVASPYVWDLSRLYSTGEVTLLAVPEPSALLLVAGCVLAGWSSCNHRQEG